ncbi:MAG: peroxiredoxin family protein [Pyrinomonadaceae bacterium]
MIHLHIIAMLSLLLALSSGTLPQSAPPQQSSTTAAAAVSVTETGAARTSPLKVSELAPDFTLTDTQGRAVTLSAARGKTPVVLVFYRGYWCPYCGHQLAELRSLLKPNEAAQLYAISIDPPARSKDFAAKIAADGRGAIKYSLLSDPRHQTIDAYGLHDPAYDGQEFEGIPRASVYVIDKQGRISWAQNAVNYKKRPTNTDIRAALDALK